MKTKVVRNRKNTVLEPSKLKVGSLVEFHYLHGGERVVGIIAADRDENRTFVVLSSENKHDAPYMAWELENRTAWAGKFYPFDGTITLTS